MKQILLLVIIHSLIFHQYQKDKKEQKFFKSTKSAAAVIKEQKNNLNTLLQDLQAGGYDKLIFSSGPVIYNFTDYSFLLQKNRYNYGQ